jgi:hypothetical protein
MVIPSSSNPSIITTLTAQREKPRQPNKSVKNTETDGEALGLV